MSYQSSSRGTAPESYLVWSILNLIFCCLPLGVVALVFSVQSQSAAGRGDMSEAARTAGTAKTCNMIATIVGAVAVVIFIIVFVAGAAHSNPTPQQFP